MDNTISSTSPEPTQKIRDNSGKSILFHLVIICILLTAAISTLYWRVTSFEFIGFDDGLYVVDNLHVRSGLSLESIEWAFHLSKAGDQTYWHPLTWLSHMSDYHFFGLNAGMHHLSNVIFHILNTLLVFIVLWLFTRSTLKCFFVAIVFAIHPINVDSVAWIAERKNLLSTFFWMLTLLMYYYYTRKPNIIRYLVVLLIFILGLLSKPMLVTLPFVLLLLDYWPLNRMSVSGENFVETMKSLFIKNNLRLVAEKLPLLFLSIAMIIYSSRSMAYIGAFVSKEWIPMDLRFKNAIVSYVLYIIKMIWPDNLTFYYPFPKELPMWEVIGSVALILIVTALAFKFVKRFPYIIVGWLWFIGTLVPVSGIMQGGLWPQIAERWAYIPYIGLFIIISWGIPDILERVKRKEIIILAAASILLLTLAVKTWAQIGYWKDDFVFFKHAIQVNNNNLIAHNNLGNALATKLHDLRGAIWHYQESLRIDPMYVKTYYNLALAYSQLDEPKLAIETYEKTLMLDPNNASAHYNYGVYLWRKGNTNESWKHLDIALKLDPYNAKAHYLIGVDLKKMGKTDKAMRHLHENLKIDPKNVLALIELGKLSSEAGKNDEAIKYFNNALRIDSKNVDALLGLGLIMARTGNLNAAERYFIDAQKLDPKNVVTKSGLGIVLAGKGKIDEAIKQFNEILKINPNNADVHSELGILLAVKGKSTEAIKCLDNAVKLNPQNALYHYRLGTILAVNGKTDDAVKHFNEALGINQNYIEPRIDLGNLMLHKGDFDEAIRYLKGALKEGPNKAIAYNSLGTAYIKKGNLKKAIECYQEALQEKPDYTLAAKNLKNAKINLKINETLLSRVYEAMKTSPSNPMLHTKLGDVYRQMGEYEKGADQYRKALSLRPRYVPAMYGLVLIYSSGEEEYVKALDMLQSMRQFQPENPDIYYNIACIYAKQNKEDDSVIWLKRAVDRGFRHWDQIKNDPDLSNIRDTSYVKRLIANK